MKRSNKLLPAIFIMTIFLLTSLLTITTFTQETYLIKYGHHHRAGGITDEAAHKMADLVYEKSNGRIKIEIYPGAQLGQEKEAAEGILYGTLHMSSVTPALYEGVVDGFGIDLLPFISSSMEQYDTMLNNSEVGDEYKRRLLEKGVRILGFFHMGAHSMLFTNKEIKTLDQMKGLKMRSPEMTTQIEMFRAIKTRPTPITWGETYTALQTKVVDGMGSSLNNIIDMKFYEVTKYVLLTNHVFASLAIVINEDLFQSYPKDIQKIIIESGKEATEYANDLAVKLQDEAVDRLKEKGLIFNIMSEEDGIKFAELTEPMNEKWTKQHNATDLLEMIKKFNESY